MHNYSSDISREEFGIIRADLENGLARLKFRMDSHIWIANANNVSWDSKWILFGWFFDLFQKWSQGFDLCGFEKIIVSIFTKVVLIKRGCEIDWNRFMRRFGRYVHIKHSGSGAFPLRRRPFSERGKNLRHGRCGGFSGVRLRADSEDRTEKRYCRF